MRNYYKKARSPWWRRGAMIALALVAAFAAVQLIGYGVQYFGTRSLNRELKAEMDQGTEMEVQPGMQPQRTPELPAIPQAATTAPLRLVTPTPQPQLRLALAGLVDRNPDMVGWLQMDALPQVDLPIVQRDHSYYLRRDFDGNSNVNGTAFMDLRCSILPRSDNLIIYAHNMKSGEMFGGLQKLRQEIFYREHPITSFSTLYEKADYVPVAVVLCSIHPGDMYFNFSLPEFGNEEAFNNYIARARALSDIHPPYDVRYGDELLTLVTCYDEAHELRLVVILRKVRPDEDPQQLAEMWT